ncbi:hypothetical protein [Vibrio sp. LaRot3]|uniref:hypothetical protein n=1 Tax=Vibrio sp. LaRot3 TaxID=2998829 RepID=UPI0022CDFBAB|nr:hypothetical protein [Vibrio sp. LaRot3]MDA0147376.1 hypothetical protein [Vibrio sp. LaRot3]
MRVLTSLLCCLPLIAMTASASDDFCSKQSDKIIKQLYPNYSTQDEYYPKLNDKLDRSLASIECKVWPANPKLAILALKADHPNSSEHSRAAETSDLVLIMASTETNSILSVRKEDDALFSDAIYVSDIEIDTAYYKLSSDTVAFGIKVFRSGSSNVYALHNKALSLYTYKQGRIVKVLDNMLVQNLGGEWDTRCEGKSSEDKRIIIVKGQQTKGYADLLVKTTTVDRITKLTNDECNRIITNTSKQQTTLKFDGNAYLVPKPLQGF